MTSRCNIHIYDSRHDTRNLTKTAGATTGTYGDDNRVAKTTNNGTTYYLVDDLNLTGYPQVVEETGATQRVYTYGLQRISEYQVVNNAWTPSFYGYDGLGSIRQLTNASGAITDTYEYDAFGNEVNSTGTTPNNYLYRGEQYDSELGLYYLRARYYNPLTGRFMSRDLEEGNIRIPATLHKYLYADGDPVNGGDPTGRADLEELDVRFDKFLRQAPTWKEWSHELVDCLLAVGGEIESLTQKDTPKVLENGGTVEVGIVCTAFEFDTFRLLYAATP